MGLAAPRGLVPALRDEHPGAARGASRLCRTSGHRSVGRRGDRSGSWPGKRRAPPGRVAQAARAGLELLVHEVVLDLTELPEVGGIDEFCEGRSFCNRRPSPTLRRRDPAHDRQSWEQSGGEPRTHRIVSPLQRRRACHELACCSLQSEVASGPARPSPMQMPGTSSSSRTADPSAPRRSWATTRRASSIGLTRACASGPKERHRRRRR